MTKTEAILAALKGGKPLDVYELRDKVEKKLKMVVGRAALYSLLETMQRHGQIVVTGRGDERRYALK